MQSVRNKLEYPSGDERGTTRFNEAVMRPVVLKSGQIPQTLEGNLTIKAAAGAYTVLKSDGTVVATFADAGTNAYTLPLAADVPKGHKITFKKTAGTSVVRLTCAGSDKFETSGGGTTHDMTAAGRVVTVQSDGAAIWYIVQAVTVAAA
jgi:hypothetical protein